MNTFNTARMTGLAGGIIVGLLLVVVIMKLINKNKKMKTEYDEMQKIIRNKGYCYAFYAVMIYEAIMCVLTTGMELPAHPIVIHFGACFIGVIVQASYCIWNDAYVGLNTNLGRFLVFAVLISLFNLFIFLMAWKHGEAVSDGILQPITVNLLCGLMFAILGIVALVKKLSTHEVEE